MENLLRKKDVTEAVGAPKTTVNDWINDFAPFIPKVKNGRTTYYKPEAVDVLLVVKELREKGYDKSQISMELPKMFAIDVDEVGNKIEKSESRSDQTGNRDALLTVMQTIGKVMERMTKLEREVKEAKEKQIEQQMINSEILEKLNEQQKIIDERLKERDMNLVNAIKEIQEIKKQVATTKEKKWWKFWK
jgi:hypothetical protein